MYFTKLVDMAKTPQEVKEGLPQAIPLGDQAPKTPVYPYGLCISLANDELEKLGLQGEMPEVGDMIHLFAMARVTSVSQTEQTDATGNKTPCTRLELQITNLATEDEDQEGAAIEDSEEKSQARRSRFYGSDQAA